MVDSPLKVRLEAHFKLVTQLLAKIEAGKGAIEVWEGIIRSIVEGHWEELVWEWKRDPVGAQWIKKGRGRANAD